MSSNSDPKYPFMLLLLVGDTQCKVSVPTCTRNTWKWSSSRLANSWQPNSGSVTKREGSADNIASSSASTSDMELHLRKRKAGYERGSMRERYIHKKMPLCKNNSKHSSQSKITHPVYSSIGKHGYTTHWLQTDEHLTCMQECLRMESVSFSFLDRLLGFLYLFSKVSDFAAGV